MKALPLTLWLLVCSILVSCMVAGGSDPNGSKWAVAVAGTDAKTLKVTSRGLTVSELNQSKGLQIVADTIKEMWSNYLIAEGLKFVAGQYYKLEGAKVSSAQAVELEKLRNAASVADAEAQLAILKATPVQ